MLAYDGTWAADGILFVRGRGLTADRADRADLALIAPRGRPRSVVQVGLGDLEDVWSPHVSPNGTTIAYVRHFQGLEHVFLADLTTGRSWALLPGFLISWVDADTLLVQDRPANS
jgi:hypothetical protein